MIESNNIILGKIIQSLTVGHLLFYSSGCLRFNHYDMFIFVLVISWLMDTNMGIHMKWWYSKKVGVLISDRQCKGILNLLNSRLNLLALCLWNFILVVVWFQGHFLLLKRVFFLSKTKLMPNTLNIGDMCLFYSKYLSCFFQ